MNDRGRARLLLDPVDPTPEIVARLGERRCMTAYEVAAIRKLFPAYLERHGLAKLDPEVCGRVNYGIACPRPHGHRGGCLYRHARWEG